MKAALTSERGGKTEVNKFQYVFTVTYLYETGVNAYFYAPELKINIEDLSAKGAVYQIEIDKCAFELSSSLQKAYDLIRRAQYVNDWIELRVNRHGMIKSVENLDELRSTWLRLRKRIEADYEGKVVEQYLNEVGDRLNSDNKILPCVYTYLNFGMIFPLILKTLSILESHHDRSIFRQLMNTCDLDLLVMYG
ncbi:MAG: hypothetical protein LBH06_09215, partial [Rikenellaceae bacterium]|nr:hypothetical protein [Rikenellaceae bacterium]